MGMVVASIRSLSCTFSQGDDESNVSATKPGIEIKSEAGSTFSCSESRSAFKSFTGWSGSTATEIFENINCPAPKSPRHVFRACLG